MSPEDRIRIAEEEEAGIRTERGLNLYFDALTKQCAGEKKEERAVMVLTTVQTLSSQPAQVAKPEEGRGDISQEITSSRDDDARVGTAGGRGLSCCCCMLMAVPIVRNIYSPSPSRLKACNI